MATYWEKLKDPRWQKKRLEVLADHSFACEFCYDDTSTLHVHHKQYFKGREPWEYDKAQLSVLCESCHEDQHASEDDLNFVTSYLPLDGPCSRASIAALVAGYAGQAMPQDNINSREFHLGALARNLDLICGYMPGQMEALHALSEADPSGLFDALTALLQDAKGCK